MPQTVYVSAGASANLQLPLLHLDVVDSTNSACSDLLRQDPSPAAWSLVWTDNQTAGRGRLGRTWISQPGASLCLSVGRRLSAGMRLSEGMSVAVGVAVTRALRSLGVQVALKWPNDLLLFDSNAPGQSGGKLGGILCEASTSGEQSATLVVVGVGINLRPLPNVPASAPGAPPALPAACLAQAGCYLSAADVVPWVAGAVADVLAHADSDGWVAGLLQAAAELDAWRGRPVQVMDHGTVTAAGVALGITSAGHYRVQTEQGLLELRNGELSLRSAT